MHHRETHQAGQQETVRMRHGGVVAVVIGGNERRERAAVGAAVSVRSLSRKRGEGTLEPPARCHGLDCSRKHALW